MEELQTSLCAIDGETLMDMPLAMPRFCVGGLLPQGLSILGGAPKIGKSWLVLDLCVRIAKGEPIWNLDTIPGTTLYLCLEDPLHRVQQRLACVTDEAPANAYFATVAGASPMKHPPMLTSLRWRVPWQMIWRVRYFPSCGSILTRC